MKAIAGILANHLFASIDSMLVERTEQDSQLKTTNNF